MGSMHLRDSGKVSQSVALVELDTSEVQEGNSHRRLSASCINHNDLLQGLGRPI